MELGEKLRQARMEAGLSQRQLCGGEITRNMLSLIEHGSARPSMDTLRYLASRLGKPVSYFLDEMAVVSSNQQVMADARRLYDGEDFSGAAKVLEAYRTPDELYDREAEILRTLIHLKRAEEAIAQKREGLARELLEEMHIQTAYLAEELEQKRLLLLGRLKGQDLQVICNRLSSLDEQLHLRAEAALEVRDGEKAARLLDAAENRTSARWCFLRGKACMELEDFQKAAAYFHKAEADYPAEAAAALERCYRELEDFRQAYFYACKQKK